MPAPTDAEILAAVTDGTLFACVDLNGFKGFNAVLGHERGDLVIARVTAHLAKLGRVWRTRGDEFIVLLTDPPPIARARLGAFSWCFDVTLGVTLAWTFTVAGGAEALPAPQSHFQVTCTPRCGLGPIAGDLAGALRHARDDCDRLAHPGAEPHDGFAPIFRPGFGVARQTLAAPTCPVCAASEDHLVVRATDLGVSGETCTACGAVYDRHEVIYYLGDEASAGFA